MAKFGRNSARQRLRRATRQALSVPTFNNPTDCTPWVIGGLWPAELETVTPQTAMVAEYLKNDLQRIATSANERLRALQFAGYPEDARRAEEARIINVARAFAVLRVESTVRQLRNESLGFAAEYAGLTAVPEPAPPRPTFDATELIDFSEEAVAVEQGESEVAEKKRLEPERSKDPVFGVVEADDAVKERQLGHPDIRRCGTGSGIKCSVDADGEATERQRLLPSQHRDQCS